MPLEVFDVFVPEAYAAFGGPGAYGFGEMGAVDADVAVAGHVKPQEPGAVGIAHGAFAVAEVVAQAAGVEHLVDAEAALRGLPVALAGLGAVVGPAGNWVALNQRAVRRHKAEGQGLLVHDDKRPSLMNSRLQAKQARE